MEVCFNARGRVCPILDSFTQMDIVCVIDRGTAGESVDELFLIFYLCIHSIEALRSDALGLTQSSTKERC